MKFMRNEVFCLALVMLAGCKLLELRKSESDAQLNMIEDISWFKNGRDRFYLAYADNGVLIDGGPERRGWDALMGIGCYGEDKDANSIVMLPNNNGRKSLKRRERIDEFPLAKDPLHPKQGECVVLLGNRFERGRISTKIDPEFWSKSATQFGMTTASCIGLGLGVLSITAAWTGAAATTPVSGGASAVGAAAVTPVMWAGLTANTLFCGINTVNSFRNVIQYQRNENIKLLFSAFARAEDIAMSTIAKSKLPNQKLTQAERLMTLKNQAAAGHPYTVMKAAALFNPYFVRAFNSTVDLKMEQGWSKSSKFFDAVKSVAMEFGNSLSLLK